uniref:Tc1-like transposase DDE domain-containing protein n=1 Tax=Oncorhynchus tshawytscha TaxID=74940 RepID=A0AAZ3RW66_ONCTS
MKTCFRALRTPNWGESSPANKTTTLSTQPRQRRSCFGTSLNVLEWHSQSPDLNPIEHLWRDLKIALQRRSPSNLTELEWICREECEKLPKYRCAKLVASYPRRLGAEIAAKDARQSTE